MPMPRVRTGIVILIGAAHLAAAFPAAAQIGNSGVQVIEPGDIPADRQIGVPQVPIAPPLPRGPSVAVGVVDGLLLGGSVERIRMRRELQAALDYRVRLADFLRRLTPEQYNAVLADSRQNEALAHGVSYLEIMKAYYGTGAATAGQTRSATQIYGLDRVTTPGGTTVYSPSECVGPIVNGVCHGSIMPDSSYHPTCHGTMLNGQCTGPMF